MPSGGGQPAQTQQVSRVELPKWVDQASQSNYDLAKQVAGRPFEQYQGSRVADPSAMTTQGYQQIQNNVGSLNPLFQQAAGAYDTAQGYYGQAGDMYRSATPVLGQAGAEFGKQSATLDKASPLYDEAANVYRGTTGALDINPFLNPYTNEVEQRAIGNANTTLEQQLRAVAGNATTSGAFGGSRSAVESGVTRGEGIRNIGDLSAQLRKAGIDYATSTALADRSGRQAGAAGLLGTAGGIQGQAAGYGAAGQGYLGQAAGIGNVAGGLGNVGAGYGSTGAGYLNTAGAKGAAQQQDITNLMSGGQQEQAQRQAGINAEMQKFQEKQNYPVEQLNLRLAALGMSPYGKTEISNKTATAEQQGPDWATIGLGALKTLPALWAMSDRNTKTDITKLTDDEIPIYSYRYKGDPKSYPKVVGPMAQDIEKKYPSAVKKVGKYKTIDINNLMEVLS
jgi:hypothetical protein